MYINADFSQVAVIKPEDYHWVKSPGGEVERVMLDRIGDEKARATSLVRYTPHTAFPEHQHPMGEEILVLSGVFTENLTQHYPAGWYLRNPHGSRHTPSSTKGALIFVKLMQMSVTETKPVRINTRDPAQWENIDDRFICPLFQVKNEHTYLEILTPHQLFAEPSEQGVEVFIIKGQLLHQQLGCDQEVYNTGSWIRLPAKVTAAFQASGSGATIYVKTGHLGAASLVNNPDSLYSALF